MNKFNTILIFLFAIILASGLVNGAEPNRVGINWENSNPGKSTQAVCEATNIMVNERDDIKAYERSPAAIEDMEFERSEAISPESRITLPLTNDYIDTMATANGDSVTAESLNSGKTTTVDLTIGSVNFLANLIVAAADDANDNDGDGTSDQDDDDDDDDGIVDDDDWEDTNENGEEDEGESRSYDFDNDGTKDAFDSDIDGDGVLNNEDPEPRNPDIPHEEEIIPEFSTVGIVLAIMIIAAIGIIILRKKK